MQIVGHQIIKLVDVDSTNNYAANLVNTTKIAEGTAILARNQFAGKGQRGNTWLSNPDDNLTFSLILYPKCPVADQFQLSKCVALALKDAFTELGLVAQIKWPNDILIQGKKVAGILIENTVQGYAVSNSIIGVGINVNQNNFFDLPNASSLALLLGKEIDKNEVLNLFFKAMDFWYQQLRLVKNELINNAYLNSLWMLNEEQLFYFDSVCEKGQIKGVNPSGYLWVALDSGDRFFDIKEIAYSQ